MILTILRNGGAAVAILLILALLLQKKYRVNAWHIVCICVLGFAMAAVYTIAGITPMSGGLRVAIHIADINFIPFLSIFGILQTSVENGEPLFAVTNILGNIVMFMPLGFLLPLLNKRYRKLWKAMLFGLAATLAIEVIQLFLSRGTDIDDILLNVVGTMAGYGVYKLVRRRAKRITVLCALPKAQRRTPWRFFPYLCVALPLIVSFSFGFLDRYIIFNTPAEESSSVSEQGEAAEAGETPQQQGGAAQLGDPEPAPAASGAANADNGAAQSTDGDYVGLLVINDPSGMTVTSTLVTPEKTVTPSEADVQMLMGLFFGRDLTSALPATPGDLVIAAGGNTIMLNTVTGALVSETEALTGAATLPAEDLAVLRELVANYDLPVGEMAK